MIFLLKEISKALTAFIATEIDDYLWLLILFSRTQLNPEIYKVKYVCIGQLAAFTLIYIISLIGIVFGLFLNDKYLGIIGFIPILIGLNMLREQLLENCNLCDKKRDENGNYFEKVPNDDETDTESLGNQSYLENELLKDQKHNYNDEFKQEYKLQQHIPNNNSSNNSSNNNNNSNNSSNNNDEEEQKELERMKEFEEEERAIEEEYGNDLEESAVARTLNSVFSHVFHAQVLQAFVITLMNSGDNIAIYIPLFATASPSALIICFVTFYVCVFLLLFAAYHTARFKHIAEIFEKYGHWLVPVLLIGLGIFIIAESGLFGGGFNV